MFRGGISVPWDCSNLYLLYTEMEYGKMYFVELIA